MKTIVFCIVMLCCSIMSATDYYSPSPHSRRPEPIFRGPIIDGIRQNYHNYRNIPLPPTPTIYIPTNPYYHRWTPDLYFRDYPVVPRPFDNVVPRPGFRMYQIWGSQGIYMTHRIG